MSLIAMMQIESQMVVFAGGGLCLDCRHCRLELSHTRVDSELFVWPHSFHT